MWRTSIDAHLGFPVLRQRNIRISDGKVYDLRFVQKAAVRLSLQHPDDERVFPRLQQPVWDSVHARILDPGAAADEPAVDVHGIHALH